jgi:hypothetical protein
VSKQQTIGKYTLYNWDKNNPELPPSVERNNESRPLSISVDPGSVFVIETDYSYIEVPIAVLRGLMQEYEKWKENQK